MHKNLVSVSFEVLRDGSLVSDIQTHDNSYAEVARGLALIKDELERVFKERHSCPYFPESHKAANTKIKR